MWVRRAVRGGAWVAAGVALLAWPVALAVDRFAARDAILVQPHPPAEVETQRVLWDAMGRPGDDREVAGIYGTWLGPARIVSPDESRVVRPAEKPDLFLYRVDKSRAENPFQARTLWFAAKWVAVAAAGAAILGFVASALLAKAQARRAMRAAPPPPRASR